MHSYKGYRTKRALSERQAHQVKESKKQRENDFHFAHPPARDNRKRRQNFSKPSNQATYRLAPQPKRLAGLPNQVYPRAGYRPDGGLAEREGREEENGEEKNEEKVHRGAAVICRRRSNRA
jgi:hypothetical protein